MPTLPSSWKSFFKQSNLQYYCKGTSDISIYNCEGRMPGFRAPDILGTWARMNEILLKEGGNAEIKKNRNANFAFLWKNNGH